MNIPYTVLRTDIAGEEDWSIAVKLEHCGSVPKGFKKDAYQVPQGGGEPYERHWPYTDIRYFTPNRDRLDDIQFEISSGLLQLKFSSPLGDVYEGIFGLKDHIEEERTHKKRFDKAKRIHKQKIDALTGFSEKQKYRFKVIKELKDHFDTIEIAKILGIDVKTVRKFLGEEQKPTREEAMILKEKRKRLARSLYAKGEDIHVIAEWLDVLPETVKKYLGSKYNGNRDSDLKLEKVIELVKQGLRTEEIGEMLGMHRTTVHHYIRRIDGEIEFKCDKYDKDFKKRLCEIMDERKKENKVNSHQILAYMMKCNPQKIRYYIENDS